MKKLIYLSLVLPMILVSCESSPIAMFSANPGNPVVGEEVWFTNESENAFDFEWNFGDGYISNEPNPIHKFTSTGTFTVVLKVWSESGLTDESSLTLDVKIPTLLEIEVLEYYEEYPVAGASVILYPTLTDWENETNMLMKALPMLRAKRFSLISITSFTMSMSGKKTMTITLLKVKMWDL